MKTVTNVYNVRGIYPTIHGEGARAGTKVVVASLAGCNLWGGDPADRLGPGACAAWCDSDFSGGKAMTAAEILNNADALWKTGGEKWILLTGGEPMLQLDQGLVEALHDGGWKIAIETNGTLDPEVSTPQGGKVPLAEMLDWVCVSPKLGSTTRLTRGDELKVVLPGAVPPDPGWTPEALEKLAEEGRWKHLFVQPQDPIDPRKLESSFLRKLGGSKDLAGTFQIHLQRCVSWVAEHPDWRLGIQQQKFSGLR